MKIHPKLARALKRAGSAQALADACHVSFQSVYNWINDGLTARGRTEIEYYLLKHPPIGRTRGRSRRGSSSRTPSQVAPPAPTPGKEPHGEEGEGQHG